MTKRKSGTFDGGQDVTEENTVPLPIQTFLWRQTSPFLKPRTGKQHEMACVEQREVCKSFEKVLVQNIQFGLSPSLTQAIKSVPRWRLVQAALPHIMHCCASLLYSRKESLDKLGSASNKLLYTLHWILLDAADECGNGVEDYPSSHYLLQISAIQVFIYLFGPLIYRLKETDFLSGFRLENGLKIWKPLWEHRHPDVACFTALAKPKRNVLKAKRFHRSHTSGSVQFGNVFMGDKFAKKGLVSCDQGPSQQCIDLPPLQTRQLSDDSDEAKISSSSQQSDTPFVKNLTCNTCSTKVLVKQAQFAESCECGASSWKCSTSISSSDTKPSQRVSSSSSDAEATKAKLIRTDSIAMDVSLATYLDVAILRCLFIPQWLEEGISWSLHYLYNRLIEIQNEEEHIIQKRKRSTSLPVPKIEVSVYQAPVEQNKKEDVKESTYISESPFIKRVPLPSEKPQQKQKRIKIGDLKAFVDQKLRRSERQLEKSKEDSIGSTISAEDEVESNLLFSSRMSLDVKPALVTPKEAKYPNRNESDPPRPCSAMASYDMEKIKTENGTTTKMSRGKSLPSLNYVTEKQCLEYKHVRKQNLMKPPAKHTQSMGPSNPIITVTEHSPVASSVEFFIRNESPETPKDDKEPSTSTAHKAPTTNIPVHNVFNNLTRSFTDSGIKYTIDDTSEASGSSHYITKDGCMDYNVILKAMHSVMLRDGICSPRVCQLVLSIIEILVSLGFLQSLKPSQLDKPNNDNSQDCNIECSRGIEKATPEKFKSDELSIHNLMMDTLFRILKHLGCPHGCGEGFRGNQAESVRSTTYQTLSLLHRINTKQFRLYLRVFIAKRSLSDILDFFHAFVGFCHDPSAISVSPMTLLHQKRASGPSLVTSPSDHCGTSRVNNCGYATNFGAGLGGEGPKGIEGIITGVIFKPLVTRMVDCMKELRNPENMALYCDVRQLMSYVKEAHGGIFRRVALSGMLDSTDRPHKKETKRLKKVIRPTKAVEEDSGQHDSPRSHSPPFFMVDENISEKHSRKSIFRRKILKKASSSQSISEDKDDTIVTCHSPAFGQSAASLLRQHRSLTPRLSLCDDAHQGVGPESGLPSPKRKHSRFPIVNWIKGDRNDKHHCMLLDQEEDTISIDRLPRRSSHVNLKSTPKLPHKHSSGHVGSSILRARKRVEDHLNKFGFGRSKNKHSSIEDSLDQSRRNSDEFDHSEHHRGLLIEKEKKLVNTEMVKNGMLRFRFLLEACPPGCVPDPQLLAAALDLQAPVVARAALYLECCHFVHKCAKGHWPTWMKLNLPMFRPSGPLANRGMPSGHQRTHLLQKAAGKLFYQWAEALGSRLEELLLNNPVDFANELALANLDDSRRKQLRMEDEDEDFLDEASVNSTGNTCPFALKLIACQLLLEITTFLRDYLQDLPRSSRMTVRDRPSWEPRSTNVGMGTGFPGPRRWSMALSSIGFSQHSLASLNEPPITVPVGERKISFVLQPYDHGGDLESIHSSNTTLAVQGENDTPADERKTRRLAQGRAHLLRRGQGFSHTSSFKRRSIKLRKNARKSLREEDDDGGWKSTESMRSRRKVSIVSDRSDTSDHAADVSGEESPGMLSDDQPAESPCDLIEDDESHYIRDMPWLKLAIHMSNAMSYICPHQHFCQPSCYRRQMRASSRLIKAVLKMYESEEEFKNQEAAQREAKENEKREKKERKFRKNLPGMGSPLRRNLSIARNLDKLESDVCKASRSHMSSMTHLATAILQTDANQVNILAAHQQKKEKKKKEEDSPVVQYIKTQAQNLSHSPFSMLLKGAVDAPEEIFIDVIPVAWELLLESDQQLASTAAVVFILAAVKSPESAVDMMHRELKHENPKQRTSAILRFNALWKFRFQAWPRMEEGANATFKVPPPGIDFTLPSPKLGLDCLPVIDPPWMPQFKTKVEEVTLNQDQSLQRSFVTATKTRRKQKIEIIHNALFAEEEKHRSERENFLMTSVPVYLQAAYEPSLYHLAEADHEEDEEAASERTGNHHVQTAQSLFPSCLCSAVVPIISLLDDAQVTPEGVAVYEVASKVIWSCMVEDPSLFFRHFLEKITREKQDEMFQIFRCLLRFFPRLPSNAAFVLYNYLVGYVMFYMRTPSEGGQDLIGNAISFLWQITPSMQGLTFKDLKQTLRKEQCDTTLLLTANVPSAKKVVVHGTDSSGIPSQFPVLEDTQFSSILQESFEFFGIDESEHRNHALVDLKTNQMHNLNSFVRDFYFFKRSQYPQLSMIKINEEDAFKSLQRQSLNLQFIEVGKVLKSMAMLKNTTQIAQRVFFLHEELMKLPAFPRRALEADFTLFHGDLGKELLGMNVLHKLMWVQLMAKMFEALTGSFAHSGDIHLFLNVINGSLMLHCEDSAMLRLCLATFINAAMQFKNIFSSNGYFLIMPTLLRIYSSHQTNNMVCTSIEFAFKQFYIMHRKPFILQLFGSIACMLDMEVESRVGDANKMQPECFFKLLLSLGKHIADPLDILSLVQANTPLKPLDFCYLNDPDFFTILDAISLCVTVVAFAADSYRSHQMLLILEAIIPFYLKHMRTEADRVDTSSSIRMELQMFLSLSACMKALINNCEALARNYTGPQRTVDMRGSSTKTSRGLYSPAIDIDDDSHSKYMSETHYQHPNSRRSQYDKDMDDSEILHADFRRPRDTLLSVVAEFYTKGTARCQELQSKSPDQKSIELLDVKCHFRLSEVAHSLMKMSPYDPMTMSCKGLKRYVMEILPTTDWSHEAIRPALIMILRRLDKTFNKIAKKPEIRRNTDWNAAGMLLKGVYVTLSKHQYLAHLPHLKMLISVCQSIVLGDQQSLGMTMQDAILTTITPVSGDVSQLQHPPETFCMIVIKLITLQMSVLGDCQSLEQLCGGNSVFPSPEKTEVMLMNLILPMCQKIGSEFKDIPKLKASDILFALTTIIHALNPPFKTTNIPQTTNKHLDPNMLHSDKSPHRTRPTIYIIGFLGLKILIVCFEKYLYGEWPRIARCVKDLGNKNRGGLAMWNFLDFVVTHRTPLFVLLQPFIQYKLLQQICDNDQEYYYQQLISEKIQGYNLPTPKSKGLLLADLSQEMSTLKDRLTNKRSDEARRSLGLVFPEPSGDIFSSYNLLPPHAVSRSPQPLTLTRFGMGGSITTSIKNEADDDDGQNNANMSMNRGWSIRSESRLPWQTHQSVKIKSESKEHSLFRRTSYHGGDKYGGHEHKLFRKSTLFMRKKGSSKQLCTDSNQSIPMSDAGEGVGILSGETTPTGSTDPLAASGDLFQKSRHRLQRQKAQSRKTFRSRKSRKGRMDEHIMVEETELVPRKQPSTLAEESFDCGLSSPGLIVRETSRAIRIPETIALNTDGKAETWKSSTKTPRRRGAVHARSQSPSPIQSPDYPSKSNMNESAESLSSSEKSSLLKHDKRSGSQSSLTIVFPVNDNDDNTVMTEMSSRYFFKSRDHSSDNSDLHDESSFLSQLVDDRE